MKMPLPTIHFDSSQEMSIETPVFKKRKKISNLSRQTTNYLKMINDSLNGVDKELNGLETPKGLSRSHRGLSDSSTTIRIPLEDGKKSPIFKRKGTPKTKPEFKLIDDNNKYNSPSKKSNSTQKENILLSANNTQNDGASDSMKNNEDIEFDSSDNDDAEVLEPIIPTFNKSAETSSKEVLNSSNRSKAEEEEKSYSTEKSRILSKINQTINDIRERDSSFSRSVNDINFLEPSHNKTLEKNEASDLAIHDNDDNPFLNKTTTSINSSKHKLVLSDNEITKTKSKKFPDFKFESLPRNIEYPKFKDSLQNQKPDPPSKESRSLSSTPEPPVLSTDMYEHESDDERTNIIWKTEWTSSQWDKLNKLITILSDEELLAHKQILSKFDVSKQELKERIVFLKSYNEVKKRKQRQLWKQQKYKNSLKPKKVSVRSMKPSGKGRVGKIGRKPNVWLDV